MAISLKHLDRMTDSTGLIQHAIYGIPRRESGYTTDDNARALRLCVRLWQINPGDNMLSRVVCYLGFLEHARCPVKGFHNLMGYQRNWLDAGGCGDCQGQAALALAEVLASSLPEGLRSVALELLVDSLSALTELRSLRAQAYLVQAWAILCRAAIGEVDGFESIARSATDRLVACLHRSKRQDWCWFESQMTYANAALPHALFDAGYCWQSDEYSSVARSTFDFLDLKTSDESNFWPVGSNEWFSYGETKSLYAQQPIEACTMVAAALAGLDQSGETTYTDTAHRARDWFHGHNNLNVSLIDESEGSCCDGIELDGVNLNRGAESTLAFLWTECLWQAREVTESNPVETATAVA